MAGMTNELAAKIRFTGITHAPESKNRNQSVILMLNDRAGAGNRNEMLIDNGPLQHVGAASRCK
jgi:hypothetical protein